MSKTPNSTPRAGLKRVRAGQIELQVLVRGRGMPVVLLHGFPLDHSMWDDQIEPISSRWLAIAPDLRGFGDSQPSADEARVPAGMEQMADDVAALLEALGISVPIVLCGLSMGGYVAFEFWRRHADRLRGLVLCDTRAMADTPEAALGRRATAAKVLEEGTLPLANAMLPKLFAAETLKERSHLTAIQREVILKTSPEGAAAALLGMADRRDFREALSQITVPTLVVVGEQDEISTVDEMRQIADALPCSRFEVIPKSGHMTPLENSDAFLTALESFLETLDSPSARE